MVKHLHLQQTITQPIPLQQEALTVGSSVTGNLETYGDSDWFAITLEAGATYQFDQIGPYDAFLYLRDSSGNVITYDDQSGPGAINDAQIIYTATESGTYYLDATAYADSHTGKLYSSCKSNQRWRRMMIMQVIPLQQEG